LSDTTGIANQVNLASRTTTISSLVHELASEGKEMDSATASGNMEKDKVQGDRRPVKAHDCEASSRERTIEVKNIHTVFESRTAFQRR